MPRACMAATMGSLFMSGLSATRTRPLKMSDARPTCSGCIMPSASPTRPSASSCPGSGSSCSASCTSCEQSHCLMVLGCKKKCICSSLRRLHSALIIHVPFHRRLSAPEHVAVKRRLRVLLTNEVA